MMGYNSFIMNERKFTKSPFSAEEDRQLSLIVQSILQIPGTKSIDWRMVANQMPNRNARQCKDRYEGYLDTKINRDEFTNEENYFILKKVDEIGKKWKVISSMMKRRTDVAVKAQYRKLIRRNITTDNVFFVTTDSYQMKQRSVDTEGGLSEQSQTTTTPTSPSTSGFDHFSENDQSEADPINSPQESVVPHNSISSQQILDSCQDANKLIDDCFENLFMLENEVLSPFEQEIFTDSNLFCL